MMDIFCLIVSLINTILIVGIIQYLTNSNRITEKEERKDPYEDYRNEKGLLSMKTIKEVRNYGKSRM